MKADKKYIVYIHKNPTRNEVFYVGIGSKKRPFDKCRRTKFWHNIVNKYGYEVNILHTDLIKIEAEVLEKYYIKHYGRRDLGLGTLVNMTDGGEGLLGYKPSEETKKIWSIQRSGNKNPNYGKKLSQEQKEKMRIAKIGHPYPNQGKRHTEETKKRISLKKIGSKAWNKGIPRTEEERRKIWEGRWGKLKQNKK